ncbi:MAG: magnesium chelatase, partial [Thermofilaceae archaeon]|nr:magnesium chelatase [Thermofilaceae archaeon]
QHVRQAEEVDVKPSTRAAIWMLKAARAVAYMNGRSYVLPDDVKKVCLHSLRHRFTLKPEYLLDEVTADQIVFKALKEVEVPKS